jgi:hypothetical protein
MTTPVLERAARELAEAERDLQQRQATGKPWLIQSGEKRVALAKKRLQHFQFLATEIEVDAVKYGKARPVEPPRYTDPPASELTQGDIERGHPPIALPTRMFRAILSRNGSGLSMEQGHPSIALPTGMSRAILSRTGSG